MDNNTAFLEARKKLTLIFQKSILFQSQVSASAEFCIRGLQSIAKELHAENYDFMTNISKDIFSDYRPLVEKFGQIDNFYAESSANLTRDSLNQSIIIIEASTVTLSHALLDTTLSDLLELTSNLDREFWLKHIHDREVKLSDVLNKNENEIITHFIALRIKKADRESVVKKAKFLLEICNGFECHNLVTDYSIDLTKLKEYDDKRHAIIHDSIMSLNKDEAAKLTDFFRKTSLFFALLVAQRYKIKFEVNELVECLAALNKQPYSVVEIQKNQQISQSATADIANKGVGG